MKTKVPLFFLFFPWGGVGGRKGADEGRHPACDCTVWDVVVVLFVLGKKDAGFDGGLSEYWKGKRQT